MDTVRETHVFERLLDLNRGGLLKNRYVVQVVAALMAAARDVQGEGHRPADGFGTPGLFAVFGNPVVHSLSPVMHNAAFTATGYHGVYAAIRVKDIRPAVAGMRALGFKGASVTIPHKETVLACLDYVDPAAARIKAVNTIVNEGGALKGFNTDGEGAIRALTGTVALKGRDGRDHRGGRCRAGAGRRGRRAGRTSRRLQPFGGARRGPLRRTWAWTSGRSPSSRPRGATCWSTPPRSGCRPTSRGRP